MSFSQKQLDWLRGDIRSVDSDKIASRSQGNDTFLYLEGFTVIDLLNEGTDFEWGSRVVEKPHVIFQGSVQRDNWEYDQEQRRRVKRGTRTVLTTTYQAIVEVFCIDQDGRRIVKQDVGTSIAQDDTPEAHEMAAKGSVTDAMKRAARQFGNMLGNSLYDKKSEENATLKSNGRQARNGGGSRSGQSTGRASSSGRRVPPEQNPDVRPDNLGEPQKCEDHGCPNMIDGYFSKRGNHWITVAEQIAISRQRNETAPGTKDGPALCLNHMSTYYQARLDREQKAA